MDLVTSGAQYSKITSIGEKVKQLEKQEGKPYLYLNQGVNAVVPIDINSVIPLIDFNTKDIQVYPPMQGRPKLRNAIRDIYFHSKTNIDNIIITSGGMFGLDLLFQTLDVEQILVPSFYWGSYYHIATVRKKKIITYDSFSKLLDLDRNIKTAVIICDPNNPIGDKQNDEMLFEIIESLDKKEIPIIIDSPYRRLFYGKQDDFYDKLINYKSLIINESFSKSVGLSGQRIGFLHSKSTSLNKELTLRLMYTTNGINAFSQILIEKLLTTKQGAEAIFNFENKTKVAIKKNIDFLKKHKLLAEDFYKNTSPMGIFVIVNKSEEYLLKHRIAAISLSFFTKDRKDYAEQFSRICISVPHQKFVSFFKTLL